MKNALGVIVNYINYEAQLLSAESRNIFELNPLSDEVLTSIIIPVFNEGGSYKYSNIYRTISTLINQTNLVENRIGAYEIIVVNNNSTDNSIEIVKDISLSTEIPILIINENQQGYGNSLKAGFDFATRRFLDREIKHNSLTSNKIKFQNYTIVSTDADSTAISPLWVCRIQELMNDNKIACFGGPMPLSKTDKIKYPNIALIIDRYTYLIKEIWNIFGGQTAGANMGIRPYWYSIIGGVKNIFNLPYAMDVYMGDKIITLGGKAEMLPDDGYVCFNLRRVLENPMKWFAGESYTEGMKNIREENINGDLPLEMVEQAWKIRKENTIGLFFQLILLNPVILFSDEKKIISFFDSKVSFEKFRANVISLSNSFILEAQKILSTNYLNEITRNI